VTRSFGGGAVVAVPVGHGPGGFPRKMGGKEKQFFYSNSFRITNNGIFPVSSRGQTAMYVVVVL